MDTNTAASKWGITKRRITLLCQEGRIIGAYKRGKSWYIPDDADKPMDSRVKERAVPYEIRKRPLPLGISDYKTASSEYYYVDKTMLIKEILDQMAPVTLFTRPRRFGKTMNMDMLKTFFERSDEDTSKYFKNKEIWRYGREYTKHQGQYPVIYLSFKDVKSENWDYAYDYISKLITLEIERHSYLLSSGKLSIYEKAYLKNILENKANETDYIISLKNLSYMLSKHYEKKAVIIIDEYDTPLEEAFLKGYYDKMILFMRSFLSGGLKDNPNISFGFLTGILRVEKESIFSGLNNLNVCSILDSRYSHCFGFTEKDVEMMAAYYGKTEMMATIKNWYDGYNFGGTEIYNPWSVISFFSNDGKPKAFWQSTGDNAIIQDILKSSDSTTIEKLYSLMKKDSVKCTVDTSVIYPEVRLGNSSIFSFLLVTGYLKYKEIDGSSEEESIYEVSIPNKEIEIVYKKEILSRMNSISSPLAILDIKEAMLNQDSFNLKRSIEELLRSAISYNDASNESFYHGLLLGLSAIFDSHYDLTSNRESGYGRYDIELCPKNDKLPGIIIEVKSTKNQREISSLSEKALNQIIDKRYSESMRCRGISTIIDYGIAFSGKVVEIRSSIES